MNVQIIRTVGKGHRCGQMQLGCAVWWPWYPLLLTEYAHTSALYCCTFLQLNFLTVPLSSFPPNFLLYNCAKLQIVLRHNLVSLSSQEKPSKCLSPSLCACSQHLFHLCCFIAWWINKQSPDLSWLRNIHDKSANPRDACYRLSPVNCHSCSLFIQLSIVTVTVHLL